MQRNILKYMTRGLPALLLLGTVGCVDLDVQNSNDADAERALGTAGDIEALIAGAYGAWDNVMWWSGPTPFLSNAAGQHAAPWANFGMEEYARIPRVPTNNIAGASSVGNLTYAWFRAYRAVSAVRDGLKSIADGVVDLGDKTLRAQAYGKFMQGLAHASIAVLYDSGFVYDETMEFDEVTLQGYSDVMTAAQGYFGEAIRLASGASFTTPENWFGSPVTAADLVKMAHSDRARFSAAVARTPAERKALDWDAIRDDAEAGFFTNDFSTFQNATGSAVRQDPVQFWLGWAMQNNWILGMADQSGAYQNWINTPLLNKQPFIIFTPDTRWPQGGDALLADSTNERIQLENPGEFFRVNCGTEAACPETDQGSRVWSRPDRGTWRWSYYFQTREPFWTVSNINGRGDIPLIRAAEMQALVAEADFYDGDMGAVASFVNTYREQHGLQATDASGTNADCVPRMPPTHPTNANGCGDLWEMFKWEKRLEVMGAGVLRTGFYFDGRGWGDLLQGTMLQLPVPFGEMQLLEQRPYNFGGAGGESAAPVGTYGY